MSDASSLIDIEYRKEGSVATLELARPKAHNAYSEAMVDSLVNALDQAEADSEVRCLIITGQGRSFSAGGDLKSMQSKSGMFEGDVGALRKNYMRYIQQIPRRFARFDKPIVAAINGAAIGAGLDLCCMADIRFAVPRAKFGSTFVKLGLVPGDGGAYFLPRIVGFARALDLMLSARVIDAEEALRIGLLSRIVEPEQLLEEAKNYAQTIANYPPLAVQMTKRAAYDAFDGNVNSSLAQAASFQGIVQNHPDHHQAVEEMLAAVASKSK